LGSGNLLARSVRNSPEGSAAILILAIVAAILFAWTILPKGSWSWLSRVALIVLAAALILTAWFGAQSQASRENPRITLNAVKMASGDVSITAKASGSSLRSNERMLLRVLVITVRLSDDQIRKRVIADCSRAQLNRAHRTTTRLVYWTETGPDASGDVSTEQKLTVRNGKRVEYVCAWAVLSKRGTLEETREANALVDVGRLRQKPPTQY
jgi:hypothetical protein